VGRAFWGLDRRRKPNGEDADLAATAEQSTPHAMASESKAALRCLLRVHFARYGNHAEID
jgi:hypothetical protein